MKFHFINTFAAKINNKLISDYRACIRLHLNIIAFDIEDTKNRVQAKWIFLNMEAFFSFFVWISPFAFAFQNVAILIRKSVGCNRPSLAGSVRVEVTAALIHWYYTLTKEAERIMFRIRFWTVGHAIDRAAQRYFYIDIVTNTAEYSTRTNSKTKRNKKNNKMLKLVHCLLKLSNRIRLLSFVMYMIGDRECAAYVCTLQWAVVPRLRFVSCVCTQCTVAGLSVRNRHAFHYIRNCCIYCETDWLSVLVYLCTLLARCSAWCAVRTAAVQYRTVFDETKMNWNAIR